MLTQAQIDKFASIYKAHFGKEISREKIIEDGTKLIRLVGLVYKPITEVEYQRLKKRRQTSSYS